MSSCINRGIKIERPGNLANARESISFSIDGHTFVILESQNGYSRSKWETRSRNERRAETRRDRSLREKEAREKETQRKRQLREINQKLESQFGIKDAVNLTMDAPDWITDLFGASWLKLREIASEFDLTLPNFELPVFSKCWFLLKDSEIMAELQHLVRMLITMGFVEKIDVSYKGFSLFVSEPLRQKVTIFELAEKIYEFWQLFMTKATAAYQSGNLESFFVTEQRNAYDDEYTFLKSQKVHIDLGREAEVSNETYDRRVHECIDTTMSYLNTCKATERAYYSSRLAVLRDIQVARILAKKDCVRIKPVGVLLYGDSGVGKSAIANSLTRFLLKVNGFDASRNSITSLNMEDKFQSEFSTHHQGVIFDDICNTSLDRVDGSPTLPVIMFLNNMPMAALNANAELKGKVMIEPMVVTATTNVKDLMSNQLSNEPLSINRRFEFTITMIVRPEYRKTGTTMLDAAKIAHMADDHFPDYALFTCEEPVYRVTNNGNKCKSGRVKTVVYVPVMFEGKEMKEIDIRTLLRFLKYESAVHFEHQRKFVANQKKLTEMPLCDSGCGLPSSLCMCESYSYADKAHEAQEKLDSQVGLNGVTEVGEFLLSMETRSISWMRAKMTSLCKSKIGSAFILYLMKDKIKNIIKTSLKFYAGSLLASMGYSSYTRTQGSRRMIGSTAIYLAYLGVRFYQTKRETMRRFTEIPLPSTYIKEMDYKSKMKVVYLLGTIGIWKTLVAIAKKWKALPTAQAAKPITLEPDAKPWQKTTEFWDAHARERQYLFGDAGVSEKSRTISKEDFARLIGKKLMIVEKKNGQFCNVVPLKSNVLLLPNHMVGNETEYVTLTKVGGHTFKGMPLDNTVALRVPGTDFAVWYCPGAGLHKDITEYYPKDIDEGKKIEVFTIFNKDGQIARFSNMMALRSRVVTTQGGVFQGYKYTFPEETFGGLCMATLIGHVRGIPFIAGHHLAGKGQNGAAGVLTRKMLVETIDKLDERPCVLVSHSATPMHTNSMGIEFGPLTRPHDKCITHSLDLTSRIRVFGGHNGKTGSTPKSSVVTSLISSHVRDVMGIEKIHGPPKEMGAMRHKEVDIRGKVDTATEFDSTLLNKAVIDFEISLNAIPQSELEKLGKISDDVNLAGLDGVLGVNAMNFATSIGFPGKGPKTQFVEKSKRQVPGISCPRDVDPMILEEMASMETILRSGKQINAPFKASLKDEPTKLTKDKVRVFAAANMPCVMLVRKYFLTLAALVQRNKIATECAVGTIVQSPEWTDVFNHIGKHGWHRCIAGDYAKFDTRMSPQFMLAAFKLLIKLAEKSGNYDEDDLTVMRGIATEISYPTYDYFGTLVQFMGSNPSGHPLTVVINSFVNSLYLRYCWYAIAKEKRWWRTPLFGTQVSVMTYGDDNIMTVAEGYDDYNHTAIAEQLAKVGITYTMADKEAESVPFIPLQSASFLKHYAVWDDELGLYRSPIEEDSIAKMLHTHIRSDVLTMEQSSAEAIQNVALKYFEFGRDVYMLRKAQLEEVARDAGILGYVGPIMTYDERLEWYREKFDL